MYILTPYTIQSFCIAISSRFRINPFPIPTITRLSIRRIHLIDNSLYVHLFSRHRVYVKWYLNFRVPDAKGTTPARSWGNYEGRGKIVRRHRDWQRSRPVNLDSQTNLNFSQCINIIHKIRAASFGVRVDASFHSWSFFRENDSRVLHFLIFFFFLFFLHCVSWFSLWPLFGYF